MNESFLHYVWQFQYFCKTELKVNDGQTLSILRQGNINTNAGPDFSNAKIKIGTIEWVGNVEIHINASDWVKHKHYTDKAYENVVLHVVWNNDRDIYLSDGTPIPTLELNKLVDGTLLTEYKRLVTCPESIPCEKNFTQMSELLKFSMLDKALMQRLENKASKVTDLLLSNSNAWEETLYQILAQNFGFKINTEPFLQLSKSLPYRLIQKHSDKLLQIEALLFGQAGMLIAKNKEEYITLLFREYELLSKKYSLAKSQLNTAQWKFLRLRPGNFPTTRLAQFASLLYHQKHIFSRIIEAKSYQELVQIFSVAPSAYWRTHYRFGEKAKSEVPAMGLSSINIILINSVIPLLVAYGRSKDDYSFVEKAVNLLQEIPAEENRITRVWQELGLKVKNAFDSQALIEQYNNFCLKRQCLNCSVGSSILKPRNVV